MRHLPGLKDGKLRNLEPLRQDPLAKALAALNGGGEETRLIGGAVRDLALGIAVEDFDLATTARPDEVIRRASAAGFKVIATGVSHGTVTLVMDGRPIETTTLREDIETDGRHAKVAFGRDFSADARRRDFTINALSLGPDGTVHDTVGGLRDLAGGRVRFIGDAEVRIREDYLRILRFFRFSARFGAGAVDAAGLSASIRNRGAIARVSRERVRAEALKLLAAPHAGPVIQIMGESGILDQLCGFAYVGRFRRALTIENGRRAEPDSLLRLAALTARVEEDAERLRHRLRLTNNELERVASAARVLAQLHSVPTPPSTHELRVLLLFAKRQAARDALFLAQADSGSDPDDPAFASADRFLAETQEPEVPISGSDIIARGVEKGPLVGDVLRFFRQRWAQARFPSDPDALERLLQIAIGHCTQGGGKSLDSVNRTRSENT
jgi:tRNA nucleotidyltransferase/poly(A) polymerase